MVLEEQREVGDDVVEKDLCRFVESKGEGED